MIDDTTDLVCPYKEIPLTKGKFAKVSPEDYSELIKYKWHSTTTRNVHYAARDIHRNGKQKSIYVYMHRQILNACDTKEFEIDHINGDTLDNRRENLRLVSHKQNLMNQKPQYGRSSKFKGVYWSNEHGFWIVQIKENGKVRTVAGIESEEIAGLIYDFLALDRFKKFARFNNPDLISYIKSLNKEVK